VVLRDPRLELPDDLQRGRVHAATEVMPGRRTDTATSYQIPYAW
jgi:hypothetical protein